MNRSGGTGSALRSNPNGPGPASSQSYVPTGSKGSNTNGMYIKQVKREIGPCPRADCDGPVIQQYPVLSTAPDANSLVRCDDCATAFGGLHDYLTERIAAGVERTALQKPPEEVEITGPSASSWTTRFKEWLFNGREPLGITCPYCGRESTFIYPEYERRVWLAGLAERRNYYGPRSFVECTTCLAVWTNRRELGVDTNAVKKDSSRQEPLSRLESPGDGE